MMRIGIIADTHGSYAGIEKAINAFGNVNLIIHAGDHIKDGYYIRTVTGIDTLVVRGNCDFDYSVKDEILMTICGFRVFLTHGHRYKVKTRGIDYLYPRAIEQEADICIFAHTHIPLILRQGGCIFINPGSPSLLRNGIETSGILEIKNNSLYPEIIIL